MNKRAAVPCSCFSGRGILRERIAILSLKSEHKLALRTAKNQSMAGFTLMELLVALSVFAVVMVMVTAGLNTVLDLRGRLQAQGQYWRDVEFALLVLERDFTQMIQYGTQPDSLFYEKPDLIRFIRTGMPNPMARQKRGVLQKVRYSVSGDTLIRTTFGFLKEGADKEEELGTQFLLHKVEGFDVRFWTDRKQWVDQWPIEESGEEAVASPHNQDILLPKAVVFNLKIKGLGVISRVFYIPLGRYDVSS